MIVIVVAQRSGGPFPQHRLGLKDPSGRFGITALQRHFGWRRRSPGRFMNLHEHLEDQSISYKFWGACLMIILCTLRILYISISPFYIIQHFMEVENDQTCAKGYLLDEDASF